MIMMIIRIMARNGNQLVLIKIGSSLQRQLRCLEWWREMQWMVAQMTILIISVVVTFLVDQLMYHLYLNTCPFYCICLH